MPDFLNPAPTPRVYTKKEISMQHPRSATSNSDSRHGGVIAGLFCAGIVVFLVLLLAGVIVTRTVHVRGFDGENGADVAIDTPGGRLNIRTREHMNPAINGVPVYPGAYRADDGGANIEWTSDDASSDKNLYIIGGEFRTKDSVSQVVEFYRQQLPSLMIVSRHNESARLEYREGGMQRIVSINQHGSETRIGVASIGDRASN
jgi:hypothetical protein